MDPDKIAKDIETTAKGFTTLVAAITKLKAIWPKGKASVLNEDQSDALEFVVQTVENCVNINGRIIDVLKDSNEAISANTKLIAAQSKQFGLLLSHLVPLAARVELIEKKLKILPPSEIKGEAKSKGAKSKGTRINDAHTSCTPAAIPRRATR